LYYAEHKKTYRGEEMKKLYTRIISVIVLLGLLFAGGLIISEQAQQCPL